MLGSGTLSEFERHPPPRSTATTLTTIPSQPCTVLGHLSRRYPRAASELPAKIRQVIEALLRAVLSVVVCQTELNTAVTDDSKVKPLAVKLVLLDANFTP